MKPSCLPLVQAGMKYTFLAVICGALLFQTACAAGVAVRPVGTHTQALRRADAVAIARNWCADNGWYCDLDDVDLVNGDSVWLLDLDASRWVQGHGKGNGKGHDKGKGHFKGRGKGHEKHHVSYEERAAFRLAIDAWSGELLDVRRG